MGWWVTELNKTLLRISSLQNRLQGRKRYWSSLRCGAGDGMGWVLVLVKMRRAFCSPAISGAVVTLAGKSELTSIVFVTTNSQDKTPETLHNDILDCLKYVWMY